MGTRKEKLSQFLGEVVQWSWEEFVRAELDISYSTSQSIVFSLIRSCAMEDLKAIRTAINRLDGKLETPIRTVLPKVYYLFPNAIESDQVIEVPEEAVEKLEAESGVVTLSESQIAPDSPTKGLRTALDRMAEKPRKLPEAILKAQLQVEKFVRNEGRCPDYVPNVQSVVVAHILKMAQDRNIDAVNEVFDQLDGKLVETVRVVGEDMFILNFSKTAPPGAIRNEKGVLMIEATQSQNMWRKRLEGNNPIIVEE